MYLLIGIIIILVIVLLYFFVCPGIFIIKSSNLSGYWMDMQGNIYYINMTNNNSFEVTHKNITQKGTIRGTIFNNSICMPEYCGSYSIKTNIITFKNGIEWYKAQY